MWLPVFYMSHAGFSFAVSILIYTKVEAGFPRNRAVLVFAEEFVLTQVHLKRDTLYNV
jgi:hypothetical protein